MTMKLEDMYPPNTRVYDATILREMDGTAVGSDTRIIYAAGTSVRVVLDDPERPDMADVQLPNGKTIRVWQDDVRVNA